MKNGFVRRFSGLGEEDEEEDRKRQELEQEVDSVSDTGSRHGSDDDELVKRVNWNFVHAEF